MTYCLGILLNDGLVMAADTRTNAGVDMVSRFRKLHVFENPGERMISVLTAGNLAITQAVLTQLEEGLDGEGAESTLYHVESLSGAAQMVGRALRNVKNRDGDHLQAMADGFVASFIVGGQIQGRRMRLFEVYAAGNFIEATEDTAYLQIGESKYGKPILDRVVTPEMDLTQAAKCALVSMDSTMRSNIAVALPIDLLIARRDTYRVATLQRIERDDPYFAMISNQWGEGLRALFDALPAPAWLDGVNGHD